MSRYIDAEKLKSILRPMEWGTPDERWVPEHEIANMLDFFPAADVVEVVRCKDCKWIEKWYKELPPCDTGLYCTRPNQQSVNLLPTDYCSYGEVKNNE